MTRCQSLDLDFSPVKMREHLPHGVFSTKVKCGHFCRASWGPWLRVRKCELCVIMKLLGKTSTPTRDQRSRDAGPHPPSASRRTRGPSSIRQIIFVLAGRHSWGRVCGLLTWNTARGSSSPRPAGPSLNRGVTMSRSASAAAGGPTRLWAYGRVTPASAWSSRVSSSLRLFSHQGTCRWI